jgi:transcriptional regulator with XRE-family HTH domain
MEYRKSNPAFREFLRAEMQRRNFNGKELGEAAGLSPSTMTRWLNGRLPSVESLKTASANMGWDLDELLALSGHREHSTAPVSTRHEQLCAQLRLIDLTDERYEILSSMIDRYLVFDRRQRTSPRRSPAIPE